MQEVPGKERLGTLLYSHFMKTSDSHSFLGLDPKVWWTMFILAAIAVVAAGFKLITETKCVPFDIHVRSSTITGGQQFYVGDNLALSTSGQGIKVKNIEWNFGDNTPPAFGSYVNHGYAETGSYVVKATMHGK